MLWASLQLPTVSALICAQSATHSSQMKTQLSSERRARAQPPSTRLRTSCCDLPQNEQDNWSGAAVEVISFAASVFQFAKPNCCATISMHSLCDSETLFAASESRSDFA